MTTSGLFLNPKDVTVRSFAFGVLDGCGAGGAVLWRILLQTAALGPQWIGFQEPLMGSPGNLLEVITLTAVTGLIYVNAQGYTE